MSTGLFRASNGPHGRRRLSIAQRAKQPVVPKTHCKRGHLFDAANTRVDNGRRICRACERARFRARTDGKHRATDRRNWSQERVNQLCDLIADGYSQSAVARAMGITDSQVSSQFRRIKARLGWQAC